MSSAPHLSTPHPNAAISAHTTNIYSTKRQDVPPIVNSSASTSVPHFDAQSLENSVLNSSHHVLNTQSSTRPRTSNQVFSSSTDLAAHYGIPLSLPPLPNLQFRCSDIVAQPPSHSTAIDDLSALKASYLNMLSQKPTEPTSSIDMSNPTVSPADLQRPVASDFGDLEGILRTIGDHPSSTILSPRAYLSAAESSSPHAPNPLASPFEPNDYLTSPWTPSLDNFGDSPADDTPYNQFLSTPLIDDNNFFAGSLDMPLFGSPYLDEPLEKEPSVQAPPLDTCGLLTLSPSSPALNPSLLSPAQPLDNSTFPPLEQASSSSTNARRRTSATGTRKNITPDSLVPIDAPTQSRRYITPSTTSRKELPAVFARKRARQQMLDGEEDELAEEPLKPNATEVEQIEYKRRQNTLAARKSRKRKLQHQQELETKVADLQSEKEVWRQRALMLQHLLQSHGVPFNEFQD